MSNLPVNNVPHQPPPLPHEIRTRLDPPVRRFGPLPETLAEPIPGGRSIADPWRRLGAGVLDAAGASVAVLVVVAPVVLLTDAGWTQTLWGWDRLGEWTTAVAAVAEVLAIWIYAALTLARWGGSPGMLVTGVRVVRAGDAAPVGHARASARLFAFAAPIVVPTLGVWLWLAIVGASIVAVAVDRRRRALWDRVAGTLVVASSRSVEDDEPPSRWARMLAERDASPRPAG